MPLLDHKKAEADELNNTKHSMEFQHPADVKSL